MVFEVFRRQQKKWLAILAVVAMLLFVLGSVFERLSNPRNQIGRDRPICKVWGRTVYASEFGRLQEERVVANNFIQQAETAVGLPSRQGFDTRDGAIAEELILSGWAERVGITATDEDVQQYINDLTDNKLSREMFRSILVGDTSSAVAKSKGQRARPSLGVGERELFNILARRIRFLRAQQYAMANVVRDTPFDQWRQREPLLTLAQIEFIKVPADKFVGNEAPTDEAALQKVYDKYKNIETGSDSKNPGFKIPTRYSVEYIVADADKFLDKVTVTDDELLKYYNANPAEFEEEPVIPAKPRNLPAPAGTGNPGDKAPPPPKSLLDDKTKQPTPPAKSDAKTSTLPAKDTKKADVDKKPEPGKKTSLRSVRSPVSDVVSVLATGFSEGLMFQEAKKDDKGATKQTPPVKNDGKDAKSTTPNTEKKPAETTPSTSGVSKATDDKKGAVKPADIIPPAPESIKPKIKPFEKVKDEVAKQVKRKKAFEYVKNQLSQVALKNTMYPYSDEYSRLEKIGGADAKFPPAPDLKKLAEQNKWDYTKKELLTKEQLLGLPGIGASGRATTGGQGISRESFVVALDAARPYRGFMTQEFNGTKMYVAWKTAQRPAEIPPLKDIRDRVVKVWREELAVPKAVAEAKRLAEVAIANKGDLAKAITKESGYVTTTVAPFTRMQNEPRIDFFTAPRMKYNTIPQIPSAGEKFLEAVFKMKPGEINVLTDEIGRDQYVVKLRDRTEPDFQSFAREYTEEIKTGRQGFMLMLSEPFRRQRLMTYELLRAESGFEFVDRARTSENGPQESPEEAPE